MSTDLLIPEPALVYLMRSAPYRYKVYGIEKRRSNEKRIIAQPAREVKTIQHWIMKHILCLYPIHSAATAYRKGRGILRNAKPHARRRFLLKLDFKNFFHSIRAEDFKRLIEIRTPGQFTAEEVDLLCRALFWNRGRRGKLILSIGAPSSPALSNLIMYEFDAAVQSFCTVRKIRYTRYADDLTFSSNIPKSLWDMEQQVANICRELRFPILRLNRSKTVHASKAGARRVTGLVLSNEGTVSIGRAKKRELRAAVHHFLNQRLDEEQTASLRGMLAFVRSVEPAFIDRLCSHYGRSKLRKILE